jgi:hypothetical protein
MVTYEWQGFMRQATSTWQVNGFKRPKGITEAPIDAYSGMAPGAFTTKQIKELFITGTQPTAADDTKVALQIDSATGLLWADGCDGPPVTQGFLDLSRVESAFTDWHAADLAWIERAKQGPGVTGGPVNTATTYFLSPGYQPNGATWGAPWAPTETCVPAPKPPPDGGGGAGGGAGGGGGGPGGGGGGGGGPPVPTPEPTPAPT